MRIIGRIIRAVFVGAWLGGTAMVALVGFVAGVSWTVDLIAAWTQRSNEAIWVVLIVLGSGAVGALCYEFGGIDRDDDPAKVEAGEAIKRSQACRMLNEMDLDWDAEGYLEHGRY